MSTSSTVGVESTSDNGRFTFDDFVYPALQHEEDFTESIHSRSFLELVLHFRSGKPPLPINSFEDSYTSNACESVEAPPAKSSTYKEFQ